MSNINHPKNADPTIPLSLRLKSRTTTVFLDLLPSCTIHELKIELLSSLKESQKHLDPSLIPANTSEIKLALPKHGTADPAPGSASQILMESTIWVPLEINLDDLEPASEGGGRKRKNKGKVKGNRKKREVEGEERGKEGGQDNVTLLQLGFKDGGIVAFSVVKEGEEEDQGFEVKVPRDEDAYDDDDEEEEGVE